MNLSKEEFLKNKESNFLFQIYTQITVDELTPINIFYSLKGKNKFLLESGDLSQNSGRYSFMGMNPYMSLKSNGKNIQIKRGDKIEEKEGDILDTINELISFPCKKELDIPFLGGGLGYIGYDVIRQYEIIGDKNIEDLNIPESYIFFYEYILCYDKVTHSLKIIYNVFPEDTLDYEIIKEYLESIKENINSKTIIHKLKGLDKDKKVSSNFTEEEYCNRVQKAKEYIINGDIFQVVLSQRFTIKTKTKPFDAYRRLRCSNPSPYLFFIEYDEFSIVGSSPESLVSLFGDTITTNPIAGTRKRGINFEEDEKNKNELINDPKEVAEHLMLVDLGRNDIGKISEFNSVKLDEFLNVKYFSHVMHLVSTVSGKLKKDLNCFSALKSCLPAGTVSGAPKIRAMDIIDELENIKRGIYAGGIGYFSFGGNMDMCIAIRTIIFKEGTAYIQSGAGIVYDSIPQNEYIETLNKALALMEVI